LWWLAGLLATSHAWAEEMPAAGQVLEETGVSAGLAVVVGTTDGALEVELAAAGRLVVQGLAFDEASLAKGRQSLLAADSLASVVAAEPGASLPYPDRIANLLVCDADRPADNAPSRDELLRVVAPGGALYLRSGGKWEVVRPQRPAGMVEWPSFDGGKGTPHSSADRTIVLPLMVRWIDGPLLGQTPAQVDIYATVSAGGRLFQVTNIDDANVHLPWQRRPLWLVARDAYNGTRLWRKPYPLGSSVWTGRQKSGGPTGGLVAAAADRVFVWGGDDSLLALDAATGEEKRRIALGSPRRKPGTLRVQGGRLLAQVQEGWAAFNLDGSPAWRATANDKWTGFGNTMATHLANDELLVLQEPERVRAIDIATGKDRWTAPLPGKYGLQMVLPEVVVYRAAGVLQALSSADGKPAWSLAMKGVTLPGSPDAYAWNGGVAVGGKRLDPLTGKESGTAPTANQDRCTPPLFLPTFGIRGHGSQLSCDDPKTRLANYGALRLACNSGNAAANGLIYAVSSDCLCSVTHVRGVSAHGSTPVAVARVDLAAARPVVAGAGKPAPAVTGNGRDWPMYRQNLRRSAGLDCTPVRSPRQVWSAKVSGPLPAGPVAESRLAGGLGDIRGLTCAGGILCAADAARQRVIVLDSATGRRRWGVQLGAGIDSPPTISQGRVVFGSHDGWVYCCSANDGALIWRSRAAPADSFLPAYGQLASRWPVVGAVTVDGDVVYATAGRTTAVDGGLALCAFDLATGNLRWVTKVARCPFNDVLISNGRELRLNNIPATPNPRDRGKGPFPSDILQPAVEGLVRFVRLDQDTTHHGYAWAPMLYGGIRGRLLAWHDDRVFGFARHTYAWVNNSTCALKDPLAVFMAKADTQNPAAPNLPQQRGLPIDYGPANVWTQKMPSTGTRGAAFIVTGEVAVAATNEPADDRFTGRLQTYNLADGSLLGSAVLDSTICREGLIATDGRLFVACTDGTVRCYGSGDVALKPDEAK
jgi:outer membrane protein assembly factor BamB